MKKLVLSSLLVLLIFSLVVTATETRVMTLGDANMIVKDRYNIKIFPSTINLYRNQVIGQVDEMGLFKIGGHYNLGDDKCVIGLYLDQTPINISNYPMQYRPDTNGDMMIDNKLLFYYGRPFGDIDLGLSIGLWGDSYTYEASDDTLSATTTSAAGKIEQSNLGMNFVIGASLMEKKLDVSLMLDMQSWTWKNYDGTEFTKPEGNMDFGVFGRYWHSFNDEVDFIPHLGILMESAGYERTSDTTTWSDKSFGFDLGVGWNIRPTDDILFLGDFGAKFESYTETSEAPGYTSETKTSNNYLPYFRVGLEGKVKNWWDVRLGATKYWTKEKTESPTNYWGQTSESAYGGASTSTYLGSGLHFGEHLHLDVWLDPYFVLNGPYFISGNPTSSPSSGGMAGQATILFEW